MSWDGNSEIKVLNPVLREILKRYNDAGNFCDHISMCINGKCLGLPAAFFYVDPEEANIYRMPTELADVAGCIYELIDNKRRRNAAWGNIKDQLYAELRERSDEIIDAYQYVHISSIASNDEYGDDWDEDEYDDEYDDEYEDGKEEAFVYAKDGFLELLAEYKFIPEGNSRTETLKDIFPNMDESLGDTGIIAKNGSLTGADDKKHEAYVGEEGCLYAPEFITKISESDCNVFNCPGAVFNKIVITSNCKALDIWATAVQVKWFYIIAPITHEVILKTDMFYNPADLMGPGEMFSDFCESYSTNPEEMLTGGANMYFAKRMVGEAKECLKATEDLNVRVAEAAARKAEEERWLQETALAQHASEWKKQYGKYVQKNPVVEFPGKAFVFTGLNCAHDEDHPAVKAVIARGGQFCPRIIRNVDYLIADPAHAGVTKSNAAVKNINEGHNIRIILLEDLQKILDGSAATTKIEKKAEAESAVKSKKEAKELPDKKTKTAAEAEPAKKSKKEAKELPDKKTKTATEAEPAKKSKKEAKESPDKKTKTAAEAFKLSSERVHMAEDGWSIGVPEGFQYSVDPKKNGECRIIGKPYGLIVASGDEFNSICYENPYDNLMSFVTLDGGDSGMNGAGLDLPLAELVLKNNIAYYKMDIFKWKTVKSTPTVRTMYSQFMNDPVHKLVSYATLIITPQKWRRCQFVLGGNYKKADKEKLVKNMLQSVTYGKEDCAEDGPETVVKETKATKRKSTAKKKKDLTEIGFRKLSDTVSVNDKGASPCFIINNEWSFVLPAGCSYAVDSEFDGGVKQFKDAIDFSSSIKTMVMKDGGYFNFALEPHLNLMGEYNTVDACRNDDRFGDNSGASKKYVFADTDELYVDITAENTFFALFLNIRVRGAAISPYTFDSMILPRCGAKQSDINRIKELMFEIAKSIRLAKDIPDNVENTLAAVEQMAAITEITQQLKDTASKLADSQDDISKYGDYLEQKEKRERKAEEEKTKKRAAAMAAGKGEKDIVNMYIILTNEKKLGKLKRAQTAFCEAYEDVFPALTKSEIIKIRKDVLEEMDNEHICAYYAELFRTRPIEERFEISTWQLYGESDETEIGIAANWAIENTKEWYRENEYAQVRKLVDKKLSEMRADVDAQLRPINEEYLKFATAKEYLQIVVMDKKADEAKQREGSENFQIFTGDQLVEVQLASKSFFRMSITVMNCFTWYWNTTVQQIWEAASKNELLDMRENEYDGKRIADRALAKVRENSRKKAAEKAVVKEKQDTLQKQSGNSDANLTEDPREARRREREESLRRHAEAAESARKAEETRKQVEAAEAARKAEEERRQAEAAEAARKAEEERRQAEAAEAARKAEEERSQAEAAEAARKAEEARRQAEAAEAARKAEEVRKQAEAAEAAYKAEEARKLVEATKAVQQELLRKQEEDELVAEAYQLELEKRRLRMDREFTYNTKVENRRDEVWKQEETFRINAVRTQQVTEEIDPAAEQRRRLLKERKRQMRIVEENSGLFALFGEKARKRKAAEARIEQINKELARLRRR